MNVADLPVLPWDQLPSPDAEVWRAHRPETGWVCSQPRTLEFVRHAYMGNVSAPGTYVPCTYVGGSPVLCPPGEPPKPEPVITVDGVECEVVKWAVVDRDNDWHYTYSGTGGRRDAASCAAALDRRDDTTSPYRVAAVVLLPEDKETKA